MFTKKTIVEVAAKKSEAEGGLKRSLTAFDLVMMGLGAIIGVGIFVLSGIAAAKFSGPAVVLSLVLAGLVAVCVALSFTEVASMIPTSGSAYAYSYVALGEFAAWIVGWMSVLYLTLSCITVSSGWSGYFTDLVALTGFELPIAITKIPAKGGIVNLPAVFIALVVNLILVRGTKESASLNGILVVIKAAVILVFLGIALPHFDFGNFTKHVVEYDSSLFMSSDFMPYGIAGVMSGTALLMFAYNGFDCIASAAEECKNPEKDVTVGILVSLLCSGIVYILIAGTLVGVVPYNELGVASPLSYALNFVGSSIGSALVGVGAVFGMTAVIMMQMYSQSRILYVMSRDGMLPAILSKIHPKFNTPHIATIALGVVVCAFTAFTPLEVAGSLSSMGALFMFAAVALSMVVMRFTMPNEKRPFKCPFAIFVGLLVIVLCGYLIYTLIPTAGVVFFFWFVLGVVVYFTYVRNYSNLAKKKRA
jgi:APA family basic amino acid/polyamine antiporter